MAQKSWRNFSGPPLANFLIWSAMVVSALLFLESWLEITNQPVGIVKLLNQAGFTRYKPSQSPSKGIWHLTGWVGSGCFILMMLYSLRKRFKFMVDVGGIGHWLNMHMLLGGVGTAFVTVHSTYKFGGIVALSYWSAVLVVVSGFLGRYLYVRIPRTVEGNELRMDEIGSLMEELNAQIAKFSPGSRLAELIENKAPLKKGGNGDVSALFSFFSGDFEEMRAIRSIKAELKRDKETSDHVKRRLLWLIKKKRRLLQSHMFLDASHRLLHHWHVFHKPFAIIMFVVMFLHIAVYYVFKG
ncbi:MAG: hypothetical protein HY098_09570 [Nitrospinae bacterium]|nr:hypothetical protein [Nitrospinota bacterium]